MYSFTAVYVKIHCYATVIFYPTCYHSWCARVQCVNYFHVPLQRSLSSDMIRRTTNGFTSVNFRCYGATTRLLVRANTSI